MKLIQHKFVGINAIICFIITSYYYNVLTLFFISDRIIAHQMLEAANLPISKKELVKTTLKDFSSDDMRNQILKVFCEEEVPDVAVSSSDKSQIHVVCRLILFKWAYIQNIPPRCCC